MNCLGSGILIPFSKSVTLPKIAHLLFTIASTSCYSISITRHCASAIMCTFVACYTFNCTFVDSCSSFATTFFSFASFYIICASTKCYALASSSFDSLMHIKSTDVACEPYRHNHVR